MSPLAQNVLFALACCLMVYVGTGLTRALWPLASVVFQ